MAKRIGLAKASLATRRRVARLGGKASFRKRRRRSIKQDRARKSQEPWEKAYRRRKRKK